MLAGIIIAPSVPGALLATAALTMFLARQPLKIAVKDRLSGKSYPRTRWAASFGVALLLGATVCLISAFSLVGPSIVAPLLTLIVLAAVQFAFDVKGQGRNLGPELVGATAAALFAPAIVLAGGASQELALQLGVALALHAWLAIFYVSARLERVRLPASVWLLAIAGVAFAAGLVFTGQMGWPISAGFAILALRAMWGTSRWSRVVRPQVVGMQEVAYCVLLVVALSLSA